MAGIAEDWKQYTIRDKILFCSSILPLFISVIYLLYYFPILSTFLFDEWSGLGLGQYLFEYNKEGNPQLFNVRDEGIDYIMRPIWILLSSLSLAIYGFILFKTDEEVYELLNQRPGPNNGPSSLFRTNIIMTIAAGSQILILFFIFLISELDNYSRTYLCTPSDIFLGSPEVCGYSEYINPIAFLYFPTLVATVALAYYSRIKNVEENAEFIEIEQTSITADEGSVSGDQSSVKQSHIFLLVTLVGGMFGLDKAYKGDYVLAVLKLLTLGGLWIWQIYDIYVAAGEAGRSWALDSDSSLTTEKHVILITAIVGGHLGLDRAYKGDGVTGVFKLLTLGGLGIWWLVDVYVAAKEAGKSW